MKYAAISCGAMLSKKLVGYKAERYIDGIPNNIDTVGGIMLPREESGFIQLAVNQISAEDFETLRQRAHSFVDHIFNLVPEDMR